MSSDASKQSLRSQRRCLRFQDENALINPGSNSFFKNACRKTKLNPLSDRTNSASVKYTTNSSVDSNVKTMPRKRKATVEGDENKGPLSDEIIPPKRVLRRALAESNNPLVSKEGNSSAEAITVSKLETISLKTKQNIPVPVVGGTQSKDQKDAPADVIPSAKPLVRSLRSAKSADSKENADQSKVSAPEDNHFGRRGQGKAPAKDVDSLPGTRGKEKTQSQPVSVLDKAEECIGPKTRRGKKGGEERGKAIKSAGLKEPMGSTKKMEHEEEIIGTQSAPITRGKRKMPPQKHNSLQESSTVPEKATVRRSARTRDENKAVGKEEGKSTSSQKKQEQSDILPPKGKTMKGNGRAKVVLMKDSSAETPEESSNSVCSGIDADTSKPDRIRPVQHPRRGCRKVLEEKLAADLSSGSLTHKSSATVAKKVPEGNVGAPLSPTVFFGTAKSKASPDKSKSKIASVPVMQFFGKKSTPKKVTEPEKSKNKAKNEVPPSGKEKDAEIPGPVYKDARRSDLVGDGDDLYEFAFDENEEKTVKKRRKYKKKPVKKKDVHSLNPFVKPILPLKPTKRPLIGNCNEKQDQCKKVCKIVPQPPLKTHLADKRPVLEIQTVSVPEVPNSPVQHSPAIKRNESILMTKSDNNITHLRAQGASPQVFQSDSSHHIIEPLSMNENHGSPVVAGSKTSVESSRLTMSSAVMSTLLPAQSSTPKRKSFLPPASISLSPATAASLNHSPSRSPSPAQPGPSSQDSDTSHCNSLDKSDLFDDIPATAKFSLPARMFAQRRDAFVTRRNIPQFSPETISDNPKLSTVKFSVVPGFGSNKEAKMTLTPASPAISQKPLVEPAIDNCFGFDDETEAEVQVQPAVNAPARMFVKYSRPVIRAPSTPKPSLKEVQAMLMGKKASAAPSTPCSAGSSSSHPKSSTTTPASTPPLPSAQRSENEASPVSTSVTPCPIFDDLFGDSAQSPFLRPPRRSYERQSSVKRVVRGDLVCSDDEGEEEKDSLSEFSEKTRDQTTISKAKKDKPKSIYQKKKKLVQTKLVDQWANQLATHFEEIEDVELFVH